jgi:dephospho-CoA kinase
MIIGITGKSGSGKSSLSKLIKKFGDNFEYIDFDSIAHQTLDDKEVQDLIKRKLDIEASSTDRKELANFIFNNQNKTLEVKMVTILMWDKMKEIIDDKLKDISKNFIFDWILLPETHYFKMCDIKILMVPCKEFLRKKYVAIRDNLYTKEVNQRDKAAPSYDLSLFDFVIKNNYSLDVRG